MLSLFLLKFHFSSRYLGSGKQFRVFTCRSCHRRCSVKIGVLGNFAKVTGKHLCQSLFFNKVAGLRSANLLKMSLWHRYFPVNFAKFLRTLFLRSPLVAVSANFQDVDGLVAKEFCLQWVAFYFRGVLNSIEFLESNFLSFPVSIKVSFFKQISRLWKTI